MTAMQDRAKRNNFKENFRTSLDRQRLELKARQKELWETQGLRTYIDGCQLVTSKFVEVK